MSAPLTSLSRNRDERSRATIQSTSLPAHLHRPYLPHLRRVQTHQHQIHPNRNGPIHQPIPQRRLLPLHPPFPQKHRPPPRRLLRRSPKHLRTPPRSQPSHRSPSPLGKPRWSDHDAGLTLLFKLSRSAGAFLGILRRLPGPLRSRPLLHCTADRSPQSALGSPPLQTIDPSPPSSDNHRALAVPPLKRWDFGWCSVYFLDCRVSPLVRFVRSSNNNHSGPEKL